MLMTVRRRNMRTPPTGISPRWLRIARRILGFNPSVPRSLPSQNPRRPNDKGEVAAPVSQNGVRSQQVSMPWIKFWFFCRHIRAHSRSFRPDPVARRPEAGLGPGPREPRPRCRDSCGTTMRANDNGAAFKDKRGSLPIQIHEDPVLISRRGALAPRGAIRVHSRKSVISLRSRHRGWRLARGSREKREPRAVSRGAMRPRDGHRDGRPPSRSLNPGSHGTEKTPDL